MMCGNLPSNSVIFFDEVKIMPTVEKENLSSSSSRLNFRLPSEIKERVEKSALVSGVTVTDFAITALANTAEEILEKHRARILSNRDRKIF